MVILTTPMSVLIAISLPLTAILLMRKLRKMKSTVKCRVDKRLDGIVIVITGASSGIGRAVAAECNRRGGTVVLGCRDPEAGARLVEELRSGMSFQMPLPVVLPLDLASFGSVEEFVRSVIERFQSIDVLINNAAYLGPKAKTSVGLDYCFQVNFLSHFYLTHLFIRHLSSTNGLSSVHPIRVINVSSDSYVMGDADFKDVTNDGDSSHYDIYQAYATSKLAMILFTKELMSRCSAAGVRTVAVHPGAVKTGLMRHWPGPFGHLLRLLATLFFRSPLDGAQSILHCIMIEDVETIEGKLIYDCAPIAVEPLASSTVNSQRLWTLAERLCGLL